MPKKNSHFELNEDQPLSQAECCRLLRSVRDTIDVLNGKWKIPIILSVTLGNKRFGQIAKNVTGITDRMLSKELKDLEMNQLILKTTCDASPPTVEYTITEHGKSLKKLILELGNWGVLHRNKISGK